MLTQPDTALSTDQKTAVLLEALPYICDFVGKTVVVKVGGSVGDEGTVLDDVVWLKRLGINPVLVHGGGPQISQRLDRLGVETRFVEGRRFTDQQTLEVVLEVTDQGTGKVRQSGASDALLAPTTTIITVGTSGM